MAASPPVPGPTEAPRHAPTELFTPWLRGGAALALLLIVVVAQSLRQKITDPDLWWHLKTGALILAQRAVPTTDPYSYSALGKPWTAHEWLSEVLLYRIYQAGGAAGLLWFRTVMLALLVAVVYLVLSRRSRAFIPALLLTVGVALASSSFWAERPHLFSYLLLAALLGVLDAAASGRVRLLWVIPPVVLVWANLHGGFFSAYLLMGAVLAGLWLDARTGWEAPPGLLRTLFLVLVVSVLAATVNPEGPRLLLYPLRYVTETGLARYVQEWQSPSVKTPLGKVYEALLLLLLAAGLGTRHRWAWRDLVPVLLFAHLGFTAVRHVPLFALVASAAAAGAWPALAPRLNAALEAWGPPRALLEAIRRDRERPEAGEETLLTRAVGVVLVALGAIIVFASQPNPGRVDASVGLRELRHAGRWIQQHVPPGKLFNYYDYGGYLISLPREGDRIDAAPPPWRVVIDGRADVYGGKMVEEYFQQVVHGGPRWRALLDGTYRADVVMWPRKLPLSQLLETNPAQWERVYLSPGKPDEQIAIYRRRPGG